MSQRYMGCERPSLRNAGCWVTLRIYTGSLFAASDHCGCKPIPGFLTCRHHHQYEQEARDVQRRILQREANQP